MILFPMRLYLLPAALAVALAACKPAGRPVPTQALVAIEPKSASPAPSNVTVKVDDKDAVDGMSRSGSGAQVALLIDDGLR